ncbi:hypothetical protein D3C71_1904180 [compost metagenome]
MIFANPARIVARPVCTAETTVAMPSAILNMANSTVLPPATMTPHAVCTMLPAVCAFCPMLSNTSPTWAASA